jgi:hypothetical protein
LALCSGREVELAIGYLWSKPRNSTRPPARKPGPGQNQET